MRSMGSICVWYSPGPVLEDIDLFVPRPFPRNSTQTRWGRASQEEACMFMSVYVLMTSKARDFLIIPWHEEFRRIYVCRLPSRHHDPRL